MITTTLIDVYTYYYVICVSVLIMSRGNSNSQSQEVEIKSWNTAIDRDSVYSMRRAILTIQLL